MPPTPLRRNRQTKIIATLGPASNSAKMIEKLFLAGADLFRLNFSHGDITAHEQSIKYIRGLEQKYQRPIGIIADLQGPKLRIGSFENGSIKLKKNMKLRLDLDKKPGDQTRVNLPHPEIIKAAKVGTHLLMDDGKIRAEVTKKGKSHLDVKILAGSELSNNKGVNVPGVILPIAALTEKDHRDLSSALKMNIDWIAQSFVQKSEDIAETKKLIAGKAGLIAKIEKPSALDHFQEILDIADGIMIARGDLGVEIPPEQVPVAQKKCVRMARHAGKPVIVATQMLESMIDNPSPTRAEASDVATAVYDGADTVMLSAETAAGKYPLEAVTMMHKICVHTEDDDVYRTTIGADTVDTEKDASDAITAAAYQVSRNVRASCIATYTMSGSTTLRTARQRPRVPILCLTQNHNVARRLCLSYGVRPVLVTKVNNFSKAVEKAIDTAYQRKLAKKGDRLVITAGVPFNTPGSTNILRVAWV